MNDFPATLKNSEIEAARSEVLENYKTFCADNPLLVEIQEAKTVEDLKRICLFARSLSIFLAKVDIPGKKCDYSAYLEGLAGAVAANEMIVHGGAVTQTDYDLVAKYNL